MKDKDLHQRSQCAVVVTNARGFQLHEEVSGQVITCFQWSCVNAELNLDFFVKNEHFLIVDRHIEAWKLDSELKIDRFVIGFDIYFLE